MYRHRKHHREPHMRDKEHPWISAQQPQRQSVTDAEISVTLNTTAPTRQKPGRKLCAGSTLTGPPSNSRSNGNSRGGKRGRREVNDLTYSAKDLVSAGMQIVPDKCTYISVVSTMHSNIPVTSQSDQKLSKNHSGSQESVVVVKLPAEH